MKKSTELDPLAERPNLDFSKGVRGKHLESALASRKVIVLDADLVDTFPDSESVNAALRILKQAVGSIAKRSSAA